MTPNISSEDGAAAGATAAGSAIVTEATVGLSRATEVAGDVLLGIFDSLPWLGDAAGTLIALPFEVIV